MHALVWPSEHGGRLHQYFDTFIVGCVVVSVLGVVLESVESVHYHLNVEFVVLDTISVAIFTLEYLLRIYSCVEEERYRRALAGRIRYAHSGGAMIDLAAILPFFLEAFLHHLFHKLETLHGRTATKDVPDIGEPNPEPRYKW